MEVQKNYSLKEKNTFGIDAKAKLFAAPKSVEELELIFTFDDFKSEKLLILGGGSNMLFTSDFDGFAIHPEIFGRNIIFEDENNVIVLANASEDWDGFVEWTVNKGLGGLENLSLIPGTVGACPIQNIGAYGVEVGDVIEKVDAIEISTGKLHQFTNDECRFEYRNSIFKSILRGQFIITSVYFKLLKEPNFKIHYGAVEEELKKLGTVNLKNIRQAVINIRESKLPDPTNTPNAGSFFKNPVVSKEHLENIQKDYPEIVSYKIDDDNFKLAAGWMIDKLGWKGQCHGGAAVHDKQALVLVNKNNASGKEIIELAQKIRQSVIDNFKVELEFEVNVIGN